MKIGIHGINGKMGLALAKEALQTPDIQLSAASVRVGHAWAEQRLDQLGIADAPVRVTTNLEQLVAAADVILDFTRPDASQTVLTVCRKLKKPMLIGTTGFSQEALHWIERAAQEIPLILAPNTSIGINILMEVSKRVAKILPYQQWDIDIFEAHHRHKIDAPSGTALRLGEAIAQAQHTDFESRKRYPYQHKRKEGDIGLAVKRAGEIVGEHEVSFSHAAESLRFIHEAHDRSVFAQGALKAARWLHGREAGWYTMAQVLGFDEAP